jgi:sugar phosphate isomerase/epimerase/glyoxylase-like metal-dependent hydrolase (beta-lactamase superfamily II)
MSRRSRREIYFSFFMFTADLRPEDPEYTRVLVRHMRKLAEIGYDGFDLHIADQPASVDHQKEVDDYRRLKQAFDEEGVAEMKFATNVGTTALYDPTSPYREQREQALDYLKSRVDITGVLGGEGSILSGPFLYPYGEIPKPPLWSDTLQDWIKGRYENARSVLEEFADYAAKNGVKLALEPVKNWETPPPNMVSEVLDFVESLRSAPCGITIDTAQVLLESQGPKIFRKNVDRAVKQGLLNYVHISPPDRGAVHDCWIPWNLMLGKIEPVYDGPYLIEIFNAIPPFDASMRMSRRRFWRPGEDNEGQEDLNAYHIAHEALEELRRQLDRAGSTINCDEEPGTGKTSPRHEAAARRETEPDKITFGMESSPTDSARGGSVDDLSDDDSSENGSAHDDAESFPSIMIVEQYGTLDNAVRIHTFIASYTENNIANATHIIESDHRIVIVDGQFLPPYARQFREYANSLDKRIERVYLSHRHPDHWFGMPAAFSDQAVYALPETIQWVKKNGEESLAKHVTKVGKDLAPKTYQFTMEEIKRREETIDGVKYVFEKVNNAEVESQLIIKLPDLGVAIVQDLIYSGTHLYLTKDMDHWRKLLQKLAWSDYKTFLAGHGEPADKKELRANIEYLIAAQRAFDGGLSEDELQEFLVERYPGRLCRGIFPIYLPRLYGRASEV